MLALATEVRGLIPYSYNVFDIFSVLISVSRWGFSVRQRFDAFLSVSDEVPIELWTVASV